jgi:hypothetical protein
MQKAEEAEKAKEQQEQEERQKGKEKARDDDEAEAEADENATEAKSKSEKDDAYILRSLFDNAGVQGAVCHDSIVEKAGHEQVIIEEQGSFRVRASVL